MTRSKEQIADDFVLLVTEAFAAGLTADDLQNALNQTIVALRPKPDTHPEYFHKILDHLESAVATNSEASWQALDDLLGGGLYGK